VDAQDALRPLNKQSPDTYRAMQTLIAQEKKYVALECFDIPSAANNSFFGIGAPQQQEGYDKARADLAKLEEIVRELHREIDKIIKREAKKVNVGSVFESKEQANDIEFKLAQFGELCKQLQMFIEMRVKFIQLYKKIRLFTSPPDYKSLVQILDESQQKLKDSITHPALSFLRLNFGSEMKILMLLFKAEEKLEMFDYKDSILTIALCMQALKSWRVSYSSADLTISGDDTVPLNSMTNSPISEQNNVSTGSLSEKAYPAIINWFSEYISSLIPKCSLYFHNLTEKYHNQFAGHLSLPKLSFDYTSYIEEYVVRLGASFFAITLNCSDLGNGIDENGETIGYRIQNSSVTKEKPSGIKSFPLIFKFPTDASTVEEWPNIVSLIFWKKGLLDQFRDAPFILSESEPKDRNESHKQKRCYILNKLNSRMYIVLTFANTPKDTSDAMDFMSSLSKKLRGLAVFGMLKQ
jgi:hypothetical protein